MPYSITKALAVTRWDLIVNGIVIASECTKWELSKHVTRMVRSGLLSKEET